MLLRSKQYLLKRSGIKWKNKVSIFIKQKSLRMTLLVCCTHKYSWKRSFHFSTASDFSIYFQQKFSSQQFSFSVRTVDIWNGLPENISRQQPMKALKEVWNKRDTKQEFVSLGEKKDQRNQTERCDCEAKEQKYSSRTSRDGDGLPRLYTRWVYYTPTGRKRHCTPSNR